MKAPSERGAISRTIGKVRAASFFGLLFAFIAFFGLWLIPAAIALKQAKLIKWACTTWIRFFFPLFGLRVELVGTENFPEGRTLFVSNHQSWLDITLMMAWVRYPSFLAKKEIESWPWFGGAMRVLRCVFVDRSDRRSRALVGRHIREQMDHGVDFCIFPEGTRTVDGSLQPFQSGAFRIATDAKVLITPVVIDNTWWILNKKTFELYPGTMRIRILPAIDTTAAENLDAKALQGRVHASMDAELARMRA